MGLKDLEGMKSRIRYLQQMRIIQSVGGQEEGEGTHQDSPGKSPDRKR